MNVKDILEGLASRYSKCSSYEDSGVAVRLDTQFEMPEPQVYFKTLLIRPDRFQLHYLSGWGSSRLWSHGEKTFTSRQFDQGPIEQANLTKAVKGFDGMGAAQETFALLFPERRKSSREIGGLIQCLSDLKLADEQQIDSEKCHHVVGLFDREFPVHLWISIEHSYLKQFQEFSLLPADLCHETDENWSTQVRFNRVVFDRSIDSREFEREKYL